MSSSLLKKIILLVAIFFMVPVSVVLAAPSFNPFTDLSSSHPYFKEIMDLYQKGLVVGYDDKTFKPDQLLTRAEFVKLVLGAGQCLDCGNPPESIKAEYTAEPFPDVALSAWYFYCVAHGKKIGIVTGYLGQDKQGLFVPDDGISRAESLAVLLRAAGINASDNDPIVFQDVISSAWYRGYLATAVNLGLIDYHNGFVAPEEKISRGEFAHLADQVMASGECKVLDSGSGNNQNTNGQPSGSLQNISPTSGPAGTVITATGPNLKDQNQIQFGSETLTPNHPNDSTLTFPVPAGLAPGVYPVSLPAVGGGGGLPFTITPSGNANGVAPGMNNNGNLSGGPALGNQNGNGSNAPGANGNGNQNGNGSPSTNGNQNGVNGNLNGISLNNNQNGGSSAVSNQNNNGNGGQLNQNSGPTGGPSNQNNNSFGNQNGNGSNGPGSNTNGNQNTNGTGGQGNQNTNGTSSACPALPPDLTNVTMVNGCPVVAEQRPRDGNPGIFITPPQCNMCPCPNLDYRADIRAGDIIFSVISDVLNQLIYSQSNLYYIKP